MPASRAGAAAASQSATTRERKAWPAGASSVTAAPPVSPYQPIAEPEMNVNGRGDSSRQGGGERPGREHPAGPDLRLVGGGPAVVADPGAGQVNARGHAGQDRVARVGGARIPADLVGGARRPPDQADDLVAVRLQACRQRGADQPGRAGDRYLHRSQHHRPVSGYSPRSASNAPSSRRFFTVTEEAGGVRAVDEPVVVGQRQVDHGADRDDLAERRVLDDHGALDHAADAEDADLRQVDDRGVEQRAAAAGVGQRERAAGQLVRANLTGPGAGGQVGDLAGEAADVQVAGAVDDRHHQAALGVHGDAEVLGRVVGDLLRLAR